MATVTHRVSTPDTGNTPNTSGAFTPALGDLLVVFVTASATSQATASLTSSVGTTFIQVNRTALTVATTPYSIYTFIAGQLVTNIASQTVTFDTASDPANGTVISVYSVSQMFRVGADALRQVAEQENQASGGTPAPSFATACLTDNPTLGVVGNGTNPATLTPPTNWNEGSDSGYGSPNTGQETIFRNSGFTGTTITWGSTSDSEFGSTIIELNADPKSPQIFPSYIPSKPSIGLASLTIAVNLLQTTLAPVETPFYQTDWPNPQPNKPPALTHIHSYNEDYQNTGEKPHKQDDWPIPPPRFKRISDQWIQERPSYYVEPPAFFQTDWPNPLPVKQQPVSYVNFYDPIKLETGTMGFNQYDWPVPPPTKAGIVVDISSKPAADGDEPFKPIDWRNPANRNYPVVNLTEINNLLQSTLSGEANPFYQTNWPNPLEQKKLNKDWIQSRPQYYEDEVIPGKQLFENPDTKKKFTLGFSVNLLQSTLLPVEAAPFNQNDWPNPSLKTGNVIVDISSRVVVQPPLGDPFRQNDWPNPLRDHKPVNRGFIQDKPSYYPTEPFLGMSCPIMLGIGAPGDITCFVLVGLEANPFPFNLISVNNPPVSYKQQSLGWIQSSPLHYFPEEIRVPGTQIYANPVRVKHQNVGFVSPRPSIYTEATTVPFKQVNWPNPELRKKTLLVDVNTIPPPVPSGTPFAQKDWPNPLLKKKGGQFWIDYYIIDENLPKIVQHTTLPVYKKPFVPTWLNAAILEEVNPTRVFDWPNPIIVRQHTHTIAVSLLQSTLTPAEEAPPFNQNDWPNPIVGKKSFHSGWIQEKPQYYEEPPLQIAQYDWPLFRVVRRNDVGFVSYIIPFSEVELPQFGRATEVPLIKIRPAITHLDNPIITLTAQPGLIPFKEISWPNPLRGKRNLQDFITWINLNLPQAAGRVICLLISEDEYYLEISSSDYDLGIRVDDYDLDMGGEECE